MADLIPFTPSDTNYRLQVALDGVAYLFDVHWNARDNGWYFDLREQDETPILLGIKVVLGPPLGRTRRYHPFFQNHVLQVIDTSGAGVDAGFDDLGARVQVLHMTMAEFRNPVQ